MERFNIKYRLAERAAGRGVSVTRTSVRFTERTPWSEGDGAMPALVDVRELGRHLADIVTRVKGGEEITISDGDEAIARLVPVSVERGAPEFGFFAGKVMMTDDFVAPLPDNLLA